MRRLLPLLLIPACTTLESATPAYIHEVHVSPDSDGDLSFFITTVVSDESAAKCGDAAKCISWETMNPLSGGRVVADTAVTIAGAEVAAGEDLAGEDIWTLAFPSELYAHDEFGMGLDPDDISFAAGTTTLNFAWEDEEGDRFEDTLTVADGVIAEE